MRAVAILLLQGLLACAAIFGLLIFATALTGGEQSPVHRWRWWPPLCRFLSIVYPVGHHWRLEIFALQRDFYLAQTSACQDEQPLERAITVDREALARARLDNSRRARYAWQLSVDLRTKFERSNNLSDLADATAAGRIALKVATANDRFRPKYHSGLASCLRLTHTNYGDKTALDEAAQHLLTAARITREGDKGLAVRLNLLFEVLAEGVESGVSDDLLAQLADARTFLTQRRLPTAAWASGMANLCEAFRTCAAQIGGVPHAEFVVMTRAALRATSVDDPRRPIYIASLAALLYFKSTADGDSADLRESVNLRHQLTNEAVEGSLLVERLGSLGGAATALYESTGEEAALRRALAAYRRGVGLAAEADPLRRTLLGGLSFTLYLQYHHNGDRAALRDAIAAAREGISLCAPTDPGRVEHLSNAAIALTASFAAGDGNAVLIEATTFARDAVATSDPSDPDLPTYRANLCGILNTMHAIANDPDLVNESVMVGRLAVDVRRPSHLGHSNLADALANQYRITGDSELLKDTIIADRAALAIAPADYRGRPGYLHSLGEHLLLRYLHIGDPRDLDNSIEALRQASTAAEPRSPISHLCLGTLGGVLMTKAVTEADDQALNEAIDMLRTLIATEPATNPDLGGHLSDLAGALWELHSRSHDPTALDDGIAAAERAIRLLNPGTALYAYTQSNLSILLLSRYRLKHAHADIDTAVALAEQATTAILSGRPNHAVLLQNQGEVLRARYETQGHKADRSAAITLLRQAIAAGPGEVRTRIHAARELADLAAKSKDWPLAAEATYEAIKLIPRLAPHHFPHRHKQRVLAPFPGLASDCAAAAIWLDKPDAAISLLEQARGVLLGQVLDLRSDITELRTRAPHLAQQFDSIVRTLGRPSNVLPTPADSQWLNRQWQQLQYQTDQTIGEQWEQLLQEIRAIHGFEQFLTPPSTAEVTLAARDGPVVALNISQFRCDALIITQTSVKYVALPHVTPSAVSDHVAAFAEAITTGRDEHAPARLRQAAENTVREILAWLWDAIAEPVLAALAFQQPAQGESPPRLWFMPTGQLNFLPIHAAGHYPEPGARRARPHQNSLLDWAICSFTPTLRSLLHARQNGQASECHRPLVVAAPGPPSTPFLRNVLAEAHAVQQRCPNGDTLEGADASREKVLTAMAATGWVHFACHGYSDPTDPSQSSLQLHHENLSVLDIAALHLHNAEFALLSACETARPAPTLPDESIHLTAAFHLAGYRHVVGTLWPVADDVAHTVTTRLYNSLRTDPGPLGTQHFANTARALHKATQQLRQQWPSVPSIWAPWIHVGI